MPRLRVAFLVFPIDLPRSQNGKLTFETATKKPKISAAQIRVQKGTPPPPFPSPADTFCQQI